MEERNIQIGDNVIAGDQHYKIIEIYDDNNIKLSNNLVVQPDEVGDYYLNDNLLKFIPIFSRIPYVDIEILAWIDNRYDLETLCNFDDYLKGLCERDDLWKRKLELRYGENFIPEFTGIPYIDIEILAEIDNDGLEILCKSYNYVGKLCDDENLWRKKLKLDYGKDILTYIKYNFKLKYNLLSKYGIHIDSANMAASDGYLDILQWLEKKDILPDGRGYDHAIFNEHLKILEWLGEKDINT